MLRLLLLFVLSIGTTDGLFIEGCPLYGCRPSGSFSMYLNVPKRNASIAWETSFAYDPVPRALGCVANDVNIVCQSNGMFDEDKGYVSLNGWNGTIQWRDKVLHSPTLPLMDNYGDVTGSDGIKLVHYDQNGKLYPIIPCKGMKPIFSLTLVSTHFLLMVSGNGGFSVRETNAIPDAFIFLNATVEGTKGTFLPVSQPVVNASRFYVLTEFVPDDSSKNVEMQRLYAIDIHQRMAEIMTIAWYYDLTMDDKILGINRRNLKESERMPKKIYEKPTVVKAENRGPRKLPDNSLAQQQNLMWDEANDRIYVIAPPLYQGQRSKSRTHYTFWALNDLGDNASIAYAYPVLPVTHMTMFEKNTDINREGKRQDAATLPWLSLSYGRIFSVMKNGSQHKMIDLPALLEADITITSKLVTARADDTNSDILILGAKISRQSIKSMSIMKKYGIDITEGNVTSVVIAIDTLADSYVNDVIMWMIQVPGNFEVKGQISGSMGASTQRKDRIIFYAEEAGKSAKIMAIQ